MNAQELAAALRTSNRANAVAEIEARHTALFGPTNKSLVNRVKDLHTQEILDKLTEPLEQYRDALKFNMLVSDYFESYNIAMDYVGHEYFMTKLKEVVSRDGPLRELYNRLDVKPRRFDPAGFVRKLARMYNYQTLDRQQQEQELEDVIDHSLYITRVPAWGVYPQYSTFVNLFKKVLTGQVGIDDDHYWTFDDTLTTSQLVIDNIITQEDKDFIDRILIKDRTNWDGRPSAIPPRQPWVGRPPAIPPRQPWVRELQYGQDPQALQASQRAQQEENARRAASRAAVSGFDRLFDEMYERRYNDSLAYHKNHRNNAMIDTLLMHQPSESKQKEIRKFLREQLESGGISQEQYDAYLTHLPPTN